MELWIAKLQNWINYLRGIFVTLVYAHPCIYFNQMRYPLLSSAEVCLDGEEWNDGLLATLRERVWHPSLCTLKRGVSGLGVWLRA